MEDLPLGRIAALVPEFVMKDLPLGRTLMMMIHFKSPDCNLRLAMFIMEFVVLHNIFLYLPKFYMFGYAISTNFHIEVF